MALTTYNGVTEPVVVHANGATNNATAGTVLNGTYNEPVFVGDKFIVSVTMISTTASVSSISGTGLTATFSRITSQVQGTIKTEYWQGTATAATMPASIGSTFTVTANASVVMAFTFVQVRNCSSISAVTLAGASTGTTWSASFGAIPSNNCLSVVMGGSLAVGSHTRGLIADQGNPILVITRSQPPHFEQVGWVEAYAATGQVASSVYWAPIEGTGASLNLSGTMTSNPDTLGTIYCNGPTVQLDDMTFMVNEGGTLLNNPAATLPIFDIDSFSGIGDIDAIVSNDALDGADGSYVNAAYMQGKTIVLSGTAYTGQPFDETVLDNLRTTLKPVKTAIPLFFKLPGEIIRQIPVKPISFKTAIDRTRTFSAVPFQIQLASEETRSYNPGLSFTANTYDVTSQTYSLDLTTSGNIETYPKIYFTIYSSEQVTNATISFSNKHWNTVYNQNPGATATLTVVVDIFNNSIPPGPYCLDLGARTLNFITAKKVFGGNQIYTPAPSVTDWSSNIQTHAWFGLLPSQLNAVRMNRSSSSITTEGFYMTYMDAWR